DLARTHALARRLRDRRPLRADAQRIRGVLDVDAVDERAVLQQQARTDEIVGVRRIRARRRRLRPLDELLTAHDNTWNTTNVTSAGTSAASVISAGARRTRSGSFAVGCAAAWAKTR